MRYIISLLFASVALPAMAEVPKVVTDLPPVHALVSQVMAGVGTPELLLDKGGNAHSFQMRPSQASVLAEADLVVWIGPEMTPWLDRALESLASGSAHLDLIHSPGTLLRQIGETAKHGDEAGHDDHAGHAHDAEHDDHAASDAATDHDHDHEAEHMHTGTDPHAWLDPANAENWLGVIAAELARLDPANAATYQANATAAQAEVKALDAELAATLAPVKGKTFAVYHKAYGYFTDHYGLMPALSVAASDATAPGAAHLAELREQVAAAGTICLFPEAQHDPRVLEQIAAETGARIGAPLDPEGSLTEPGPEAYALLMRGLAHSLADCFAQAE